MAVRFNELRTRQYEQISGAKCFTNKIIFLKELFFLLKKEKNRKQFKCLTKE